MSDRSPSTRARADRTDRFAPTDRFRTDDDRARTDDPDRTTVYRRRARRLRSVHRDDLPRLHRSLRELATSLDAARAEAPRAAPGHDPRLSEPRSRCAHTPVQQFLDLVRDTVDGPVLPFSRRQSLLRQARRMGLDEFEANLMIAGIQHRAGEPIRTDQPDDLSRRSWPALLLTALAVQAAIVAGMWKVLA